MPSLISSILLFALSTSAREITFPPVSGYNQAPLGSEGPDRLNGILDYTDVSSSKFGGLTTFANLPYVHCLAAEGIDVESYDIAILGAPFDTVGYDLLFALMSR